jgi:transposase-like protein
MVFTISAYEHVSELLAERGLMVDASCVALGLSVCNGVEQALPPASEATNKSYRVDETYIKVKGKEKYLYRVVDSVGQTIDLLLTAQRDATAANRFFHNVFRSSSNPKPHGTQRLAAHLPTPKRNQSCFPSKKQIDGTRFLPIFLFVSR